MTAFPRHVCASPNAIVSFLLFKLKNCEKGLAETRLSPPISLYLWNGCMSCKTNICVDCVEYKIKLLDSIFVAQWHYNQKTTELTNYQLNTDVDRFKKIQKVFRRTTIPSCIIRFSLECPLSSLMLYLSSCVISFVPSDIWFRSAINRARESYLGSFTSMTGL